MKVWGLPYYGSAWKSLISNSMGFKEIHVTTANGTGLCEILENRTHINPRRRSTRESPGSLVHTKNGGTKTTGVRFVGRCK